MNILEKFNSINGCEFININGYEAKGSGEIANHNVNVGISILNAKKADLKTVKELTVKELQNIAKVVGTDLVTAKLAVADLIKRQSANLDNDIKNHTLQSQAQTSLYTWIGKGLRLNNETLEVSVFAFTNTKKVIVKGEYKDKKAVNSSPLTLVKNEIRKLLKMSKSRTYILGLANELKVSGNTITL